MLDEFGRYTAEQEAIEGVEALTAYYQEPVPFRRPFQDRLGDRSLLLAGRACKLQQPQLLGDFLKGSCRARLHALSLYLRPKRQPKPGVIEHMQRRHIRRLDERQFGHPLQGPLPVLRSIRRNKHLHGIIPFICTPGPSFIR